MPPTDTRTDVITHPDRGDGPARVRNRRITYTTAALLLTALVVSALIDGFWEIRLWGPGSEWERDVGGGYELAVRYPTVSRPALATPFDVVIERPGGFTGPVDVAIASDWLEMWDFQSLYPSPTEETATPAAVIFTFDPPDGDVLRVFLDARIQPPQQSGADGFVAVLDDDGQPVAEVDFETEIRP